MYQYYNRPYIPTPNIVKDGERFVPFFPLVPFLGGALIGGAAVGLSRPRYYPYPYMPAPYYRPYPY